MKKVLIGLFGLAMACGFLAGCATSIETSSESKPGTDFSAYKTFSWEAGAGSGSTIRDYPYLDGMIRSAVEDRLKSTAGMAPAAAGTTGALAVTYTLLVQDGYSSQTFQNVGGGDVGRYEWGNFSARPMNAVTDTRVYEKGTLVVVLTDAATGRAVWRGRAKAKIFEDDPRGPEVARSRVDLAVVRMFSGFPPSN
jgi:hypothetical protein